MVQINTVCLQFLQFNKILFPCYFKSLLILYAFLIIVFIGCQPGEIDSLPPGDPDNGGLLLPDDFEAVVVADSLGPARHLIVNDNGDIYVKLRRDLENGSIVALRDTSNDGRADIIEQFGVHNTRGGFETGIEIRDGYLYFSTNLYVFRYPLTPGELIPDTTRRDTILIDDHEHGSHEHVAKPISFDDDGYMYIPYGAPSDVCQESNRTPGSPGLDPCPELDKHGGIWRFYADKKYQVQEESRTGSDKTKPVGTLYATGIRSVVAMDWNPVDGELYVVQHGRDHLHRMWPNMFSPWDNAMLPAEEFMRVTEGSDFGWPYCYYDQLLDKRVLGPEYGGDGEIAGRCTEFDDPVIGFPGHYAPNDLQFYQGDQFPEYYKNGAFIAFHGSTIRNPYPQAGYFLAFVPYENGQFSKDWDVFANGFSVVDPIVSTSDAHHRPMGLAVGPDGTLYIADSVDGKIWRVMFKGDRDRFGKQHLARMEQEKRTANNIRTPDEIEDDLQRDEPVAGESIYQTYCASCHQRDGTGVDGRFPPITAPQWISGRPEPLISVILNGLDSPRYDIPMPNHEFLNDEQVAEVVTYIRQHFGDEEDSVTEEEVRAFRNP